MFYSRTLARILAKVPGEKRFDEYRFLPIFFIFGALLELSMIKWEVNGVNFYKTFRKKQVHKEAVRQIEFERAKAAHEEKLTKKREL